MDELLQDYLAFLRIPSISADPAHAKDVRRCCEWVANYLGSNVEIWETPTHPVVYAHYKKNDGPTLLIYGHYDVQPVDPLDEWETPPFEPTIRNGQVYARGAQDNKGQILYTLYAIRSLLKEKGGLPMNLKLLIEGEEEHGSEGLSAILEQKRNELQADYLLSPDMDIPALDQPSITLGLRGILTATVELTGSTVDLHSGMAGGIVYNPNHALVELLAKLRNPDGSIALPGFYDQVTPLPQEIRNKLSLDISPSEYEQNFSAMTTGGEKEYGPGESSRIRPTLEINGISGGYAGPGFKTVIPAKAQAKISCRLVPDQDPKKIIASLATFLQKHCPEGIQVIVTDHGGAKAIRSEPGTPLAKALAAAYTKVLGKPCLFSLSGGSVPIIENLSRVSGAIPALCGYGLLDDYIHAPNEHFGLDRMELGYKTIVEFLHQLSQR